MPEANTLHSEHANTKWILQAVDNRPGKLQLNELEMCTSLIDFFLIIYQADETAIFLLGFFVHFF